jgi:L-threonylcarbamoyladenylate synthase
MAKDLFPALRRFDAQNVDLILAEAISPQGLGNTVMNRLRQAAARIIRV